MPDGTPHDPFVTLYDVHATTQVDRPAPDEAHETEQMGSLLVIAGHPADVGTHLVIEDHVVLGRETSGLRLHDARASRRHAEVLKDEEGHALLDLGSTNGTRLNGLPLREATRLRDGDKIRVGGTVVKFALVDQTEADYLRRITRLARTDPLTGLHAKHQFDAILAETLRLITAPNPDGSAAPPRGQLCVLMMDMDGLKAVNDRWGHQVGAATLAQVGRLLGAALRGRGEACRFGGDEFCAMLPHHRLEDALVFAEALREEIATTTFRRGDVVVHVTISIGVAAWRPGLDDPEALVELADRALYRAKAAGRDAVMS